MTGIKRCGWCRTDPLYMEYHDREWGRLVPDDRRMFEFLTLESAQAGLSWITILRKRENYRRAFADFDVEKVAAFIPASTPLSDAISGDMKRRGFKFFGTTICYAHLQAVGYVNDHLVDCHCHPG